MGCNCRKKVERGKAATRVPATRVVYTHRGVQIRKDQDAAEKVDKKVRRIGEQ